MALRLDDTVITWAAPSPVVKVPAGRSFISLPKKNSINGHRLNFQRWEATEPFLDSGRLCDLDSLWRGEAIFKRINSTKSESEGPSEARRQENNRRNLHCLTVSMGCWHHSTSKSAKVLGLLEKSHWVLNMCNANNFIVAEVKAYCM